MKIRPVRLELFRADRRTEGQEYMTKLIVVFAILLTRTKMVWCFLVSWR